MKLGQDELDKMFELEKVFKQAKAAGHFGKRTPSTARSFAVGPDGQVERRRGRPRKIRPKEDDWEWVANEIQRTGQHPSIRDLAAVFGWSRQRVSQILDQAFDEDQFETLLEILLPMATDRSSPGGRVNPSRQMALLSRLRDGKSAYYERRCPHCGELLRVEGLSQK